MHVVELVYNRLMRFNLLIKIFLMMNIKIWIIKEPVSNKIE